MYCSCVNLEWFGVPRRRYSTPVNADPLDALTMIPDKISTLEFVWSSRAGGGGRTERRFRDIKVDGVALSTVVNADVISPFGWGSPEEQFMALDRLLLRAPPDLYEGRVSLYVCPECGDLGCGAVSVVIETDGSGIIWRDFAFQNNYDAMVGRADKGVIISTGGFTLEARREATRDGAPPIDLIDGRLLRRN